MVNTKIDPNGNTWVTIESGEILKVLKFVCLKIQTQFDSI